MTRLFRTRAEQKRSLWRRAVDLALTDVRVLAGGIDHETLETLEERLLAADFGVQATLRLVDAIESRARRGDLRGSGDLRGALRDEVTRDPRPGAWRGAAHGRVGPHDLARGRGERRGQDHHGGEARAPPRSEGKSVLIAAADTYRAGAVQQLSVWAERVGAEFVAGKEGGRPAAVAYDAIEAAVARGIDVVLVDTAGRLHTNRNLMEELKKVERVVARRLEGAPHETLIVLDATVGRTRSIRCACSGKRSR